MTRALFILAGAVGVPAIGFGFAYGCIWLAMVHPLALLVPFGLVIAGLGGLAGWAVYEDRRA